MYIHIGSNCVLRSRDVVAICDMDKATVSKRTLEFLRYHEKKGRLVNVADALPKSFVLTVSENVPRVYLSQISPETICKRVGTR